MQRLLIDTGAIYALVARNDAHHQAAAAFLKQALKRKLVFVLLDLVFAETMTLVKRRLGSAIALRVGRELRENPVHVWTGLSSPLEAECWALFQRYQDKDWSYTDCAVLALARQSGLRDVFAFDAGFEQMPGTRRVP
jgi:predicted nucleic acid-binding protein